jgi:hypothetical protein
MFDAAPAYNVQPGREPQVAEFPHALRGGNFKPQIPSSAFGGNPNLQNPNPKNENKKLDRWVL